MYSAWKVPSTCARAMENCHVACGAVVLPYMAIIVDVTCFRVCSIKGGVVHHSGSESENGCLFSTRAVCIHQLYPACGVSVSDFFTLERVPPKDPLDVNPDRRSITGSPQLGARPGSTRAGRVYGSSLFTPVTTHLAKAFES